MVTCKWCGKKSLMVYCSFKCMQEAAAHGVDVGNVVNANKAGVSGKGCGSLIIVVIVTVVGYLWLFC